MLRLPSPGATANNVAWSESNQIAVATQQGVQLLTPQPNATTRATMGGIHLDQFKVVPSTLPSDKDASEQHSDPIQAAVIKENLATFRSVSWSPYDEAYSGGLLYAPPQCQTLAPSGSDDVEDPIVVTGWSAAARLPALSQPPNSIIACGTSKGRVHLWRYSAHAQYLGAFSVANGRVDFLEWSPKLHTATATDPCATPPPAAVALDALITVAIHGQLYVYKLHIHANSDGDASAAAQPSDRFTVQCIGKLGQIDFRRTTVIKYLEWKNTLYLAYGKICLIGLARINLDATWDECTISESPTLVLPYADMLTEVLYVFCGNGQLYAARLALSSSTGSDACPQLTLDQLLTERVFRQFGQAIRKVRAYFDINHHVDGTTDADATGTEPRALPKPESAQGESEDVQGMGGTVSTDELPGQKLYWVRFYGATESINHRYMVVNFSVRLRDETYLTAIHNHSYVAILPIVPTSVPVSSVLDSIERAPAQGMPLAPVLWDSCHMLITLPKRAANSNRSREELQNNIDALCTPLQESIGTIVQYGYVPDGTSTQMIVALLNMSPKSLLTSSGIVAKIQELIHIREFKVRSQQALICLRSLFKKIPRLYKVIQPASTKARRQQQLDWLYCVLAVLNKQLGQLPALDLTNHPKVQCWLAVNLHLATFESENDEQLVGIAAHVAAQLARLLLQSPEEIESTLNDVWLNLETCTFCLSPITEVTFDHATCVLGHRWTRCIATNLLLTTPNNWTCITCDAKLITLDESPFVGDTAPGLPLAWVRNAHRHCYLCGSLCVQRFSVT
ncbi:hypothetical protein H4R34_000258 [Dimargaris verticillata]|uniref:Transcription factor IIIC putative zinc-finger domain-containing protein n=1 Tax=Dimargaris verticillata TaxID=2761393 RepID=A0A9W8EEW3_9FUNG|nr:hypothetical protein H4R34_000258 [Dimargaris verticillata]